MLNKQVKLGSTVHFKHGGQPHTGEVMSTAPGPEPSGQPVTLAHIEPALQGHPTITLDASDLTLPPKKRRPNLPDGPPFTAPDATFDGGPVSPRQFYLFSTYADAQRILDLELAAILKQYPGALGVTAVISDDIYGSNGYPPSNSAFRMNSGPPSDPPDPTAVCIWVINLAVEEIAIPQASPTIPAYTGPAVGSDYAGDLVDRELQPNQEDVGPTGDWGGDTLYIRALAPTDEGGGAAELMGYWNPADAPAERWEAPPWWRSGAKDRQRQPD